MGKKNKSTQKNQAHKPVTQRDYGKIKRVCPRSTQQVEYLKAMESCSVTICSGPAGSGKTYLAVYAALCHHWSKDQGIKRLIITRPALEAGGERLGFLPGDLEDKLDPYMRPIYDSLYDQVGLAITKDKIERGYIEIAPLAYMRGRTFNDSFIILDEAQNATLDHLKMITTRLGDNSKLVIAGDPSQSDLEFHKRKSGLHVLEQVVKDVDDVAIVRLGKDDIVRSPVVVDIVAAFEEYEERSEKPEV
jgi:phosphate starvation-inducible PhoH-like protein